MTSVRLEESGASERMDLGKLKRGLNHGKNGMRHYLAPWYFLEEKFYPDF